MVSYGRTLSLHTLCFAKEVTMRPEVPDYEARYQDLDRRLQHFTALLPSFADLGNARPEAVRCLLTVKTSCFAAIAQLHTPPRRDAARVPDERAVAASHAAAALVQSLNVRALGFVDGVMGVRPRLSLLFCANHIAGVRPRLTSRSVALGRSCGASLASASLHVLQP